MTLDRSPGFGIYVHWPFCAAKCPYCDFNSHVRHQPVDQERFARAFATELATMRRRTGKGRQGRFDHNHRALRIKKGRPAQQVTVAEPKILVLN